MSNENNTSLQTQEQGGNALTNRDSNVGFSLEPKNLQEALKICEYIANSSIVPKQYKGAPADILVAINFGQEVGLKPLQSLNSVAVVNGTPSLWGDAPLALVKQHPEFEFILEDNEAFAFARDKVKGWGHLKNINKDDTSICVVKRKEEPPTVREFSKEDVKKAKLGNVHNNYPKIMRRYRARSQALKATFPDVLKGFEQAEIQQETQKMVEEGYYEDVTDYGPKDQPKAEERQDIDIQQDEDSNSVEKRIEYQDSPNGQDQGMRAEKRTDLAQDEREAIMAAINEMGKEVHGTKWYQESKAYVHNYDEEAENLLDLDMSGLKHIKHILESKLGVVG